MKILILNMLSPNRVIKYPRVLVALRQYQVFVSATDNHKRVPMPMKDIFEGSNSKTNKYHVSTLHSHVRTQPTKRTYSFFTSRNTVFALSSGHGKCGVAVIRASGPHARDALLKMTNLKEPLKSRYAQFKKLSDPQTGDAIDHGLVLWFPAPYSFTGEDTLEFQTHGGPAVVLAVLNALAKIPGCRHAEPGDFTKRAFFNDKLDLTEVEGLGDLIHAETEAQRKQALRQMEGDLGQLYQKWTKKLTTLVAHVEATIDFGEDENIEDGLLNQVRGKIEELQREVYDHLNDGRRGERLRSGVHVAIVGPPNAGKSSLLNMLCQRPAAIVSPYPGTTRDVLESALDIFGYPILLSDTAGLRDSRDPIEQEGVRRALKRAGSADLKILIGDSSLLSNTITSNFLLKPELAPSHFAEMFLQSSCSLESSLTDNVTSVFSVENTLVVLNKTDLLSADEGKELKAIRREDGLRVCYLSCKTTDGVEPFMQQLRDMLKDMCGNPLAGNPSLTQARHRQHLTLCTDSLQKFLDVTSDSADCNKYLDIAAEELRLAIRQIGRITGKVGIEEILDIVFKDFCIGK